MKETIQMLVVLSLICGICALALSGVRLVTAEQIEFQVLTNVQGPKVNLVLAGAENDLIADRKKIMVDGEELLLFIGEKDGRPWAIAYESAGAGFGGDIVIMVGYELDSGDLTGIQIISHKETPGIGSKCAEDPFTHGFEGLHLDSNFTTQAEGGDVDAVTGATYSSIGVCEAVRKSVRKFDLVKEIGLAH